MFNGLSLHRENRVAAMLPSQPLEHISTVQVAPSRAVDFGYEALSIHGPAMYQAQSEDGNGRHVPSPGISSSDIQAPRESEKLVMKSENHDEKPEHALEASSRKNEGLDEKKGFWGCWLCIPRCGRCWSASTDTRSSYITFDFNNFFISQANFGWILTDVACRDFFFANDSEGGPVPPPPWILVLIASFQHALVHPSPSGQPASGKLLSPPSAPPICLRDRHTTSIVEISIGVGILRRR